MRDPGASLGVAFGVVLDEHHGVLDLAQAVVGGVDSAGVAGGRVIGAAGVAGGLGALGAELFGGEAQFCVGEADAHPGGAAESDEVHAAPPIRWAVRCWLASWVSSCPQAAVAS
jgi:hypothetical protein